MRDFRSADEKLIDQAQRDSAFYAANLHLALKEGWDADRIRDYRQWTAQAALILGEFDQAAILVADIPELASIATDIEDARKAEAADDDGHCECRHFIDGRLGEKEPEKLIEVSSYGIRFRFLSKRYGQVVALYKCGICGHVNAHPDSPDDLHAIGVRLKAAADKQAREVIRVAKGQPVKVSANPLMADRNHFPDAT